jgi:hypothetical protein
VKLRPEDKRLFRQVRQHSPVSVGELQEMCGVVAAARAVEDQYIRKYRGAGPTRELAVLAGLLDAGIIDEAPDNRISRRWRLAFNRVKTGGAVGAAAMRTQAAHIHRGLLQGHADVVGRVHSGVWSINHAAGIIQNRERGSISRVTVRRVLAKEQRQFRELQRTVKAKPASQRFTPLIKAHSPKG